MKKDYSKEDKYIYAKKKVEKIKAFYIHLTVYIIVNTGITILKVVHNLRDGESLTEALWDFGTFAIWGFWGIGLAFHALGTFGLPFVFGKNWEEKKLKELMKKEEDEMNSMNNN